MTAVDTINALGTRSVLDSFSHSIRMTVDSIRMTIRLDIIIQHFHPLQRHTQPIPLHRLLTLRISRITSIHKRLNSQSIAWIILHHFLVLSQSSVHLLGGHIVEEDTFTEGSGNGGAELTITSLEDGLCGFVEDVFVEIFVVHGETGAGEEIEESLVVLLGQFTAFVGEGGGVGHVDCVFGQHSVNNYVLRGYLTYSKWRDHVGEGLPVPAREVVTI